MDRDSTSQRKSVTAETSWHVLEAPKSRPEHETPVAVCKERKTAESLARLYARASKRFTFRVKHVVPALALALFTTATAEAQCAYVPPGYVQINHRNGVLYGRTHNARVSCTWNTPTVLYWSGGALCRNRRLYGRDAFRRPFSCRVWNVWRR